MLKAYIRDGILHLRPADEGSVDELKDWVRSYKTRGSSALDVEYTPMKYTDSERHDRERYEHEYRDRNQWPRQYREPQYPVHGQPHQPGYRVHPQPVTPQVYNPYGYGDQSYMPMPPDFSPQAHYPFQMPPIIFPVYLDRDRDGRRDYDPRDRDYVADRRPDYVDQPSPDGAPNKPRAV